MEENIPELFHQTVSLTITRMAFVLEMYPSSKASSIVRQRSRQLFEKYGKICLTCQSKTNFCNALIREENDRGFPTPTFLKALENRGNWIKLNSTICHTSVCLLVNTDSVQKILVILRRKIVEEIIFYVEQQILLH